VSASDRPRCPGFMNRKTFRVSLTVLSQLYPSDRHSTMKYTKLRKSGNESDWLAQRFEAHRTHRSLFVAGLVLALGLPASASEPSKYPAIPKQPANAVTVRYIAHDVAAAVRFYSELLGFKTEANAAPNFAIVSQGNLWLLLSGTRGTGGGSRARPDGRQPEPGGWNRIQVPVEDLAAEVERLRRTGAHFRNDIVRGNGGWQILLEDPSGNPIELFQAGRARE
jgi:predicted enzyme related to lactoylglutathione lyase